MLIVCREKYGQFQQFLNYILLTDILCIALFCYLIFLDKLHFKYCVHLITLCKSDTYKMLLNVLSYFPIIVNLMCFISLVKNKMFKIQPNI